MEENYLPTTQTILFIAIFLVAYISYLLRSTLKQKIDFYDFLILTAVGVLPSIFAFFPQSTLQMTRFIGVRYPFVVLFGALFFVVFYYLFRLVIRINKLAQQERALAQELAFLRDKITLKKN